MPQYYFRCWQGTTSNTRFCKPGLPHHSDRSHLLKLLLRNLNEFCWLMPYLVWLSPHEATQHVWLLPFPLLNWKLRLFRLHCLRGWFRTQLENEAPPLLVSGDRAINVLWDPRDRAINVLWDPRDRTINVLCEILVTEPSMYSVRSSWQSHQCTLRDPRDRATNVLCEILVTEPPMYSVRSSWQSHQCTLWDPRDRATNVLCEILVTEPPMYSVRSSWQTYQCTLWDPFCCFIQREARSLNTLCLPAILDKSVPKLSGRSVQQKCWNRFGYLSHSLVCLSSSIWHIYSSECSLLDPPKACSVPVCYLLASWSGLCEFLHSV